MQHLRNILERVSPHVFGLDGDNSDSKVVKIYKLCRFNGVELCKSGYGDVLRLRPIVAEISKGHDFLDTTRTDILREYATAEMCHMRIVQNIPTNKKHRIFYLIKWGNFRKFCESNKHKVSIEFIIHNILYWKRYKFLQYYTNSSGSLCVNFATIPYIAIKSDISECNENICRNLPIGILCSLKVLVKHLNHAITNNLIVDKSWGSYIFPTHKREYIPIEQVEFILHPPKSKTPRLFPRCCESYMRKTSELLQLLNSNLTTKILAENHPQNWPDWQFDHSHLKSIVRFWEATMSWGDTYESIMSRKFVYSNMKPYKWNCINWRNNMQQNFQFCKK